MTEGERRGRERGRRGGGRGGERGRERRGEGEETLTFPKDPLPSTFINTKSLRVTFTPVLFNISLGEGRGGTGINGCFRSSPFSCEVLLIIDALVYL